MIDLLGTNSVYLTVNVKYIPDWEMRQLNVYVSRWMYDRKTFNCTTSEITKQKRLCGNWQRKWKRISWSSAHWEKNALRHISQTLAKVTWGQSLTFISLTAKRILVFMTYVCISFIHHSDYEFDGKHGIFCPDGRWIHDGEASGVDESHRMYELQKKICERW